MRCATNVQSGDNQANARARSGVSQSSPVTWGPARITPEFLINNQQSKRISPPPITTQTLTPPPPAPPRKPTDDAPATLLHAHAPVPVSGGGCGCVRARGRSPTQRRRQHPPACAWKGGAFGARCGSRGAYDWACEVGTRVDRNLVVVCTAMIKGGGRGCVVMELGRSGGHIHLTPSPQTPAALRNQSSINPPIPNSAGSLVIRVIHLGNLIHPASFCWQDALL